MLYRGELPRKIASAIVVAMRKAAKQPSTLGEIESMLGFYGPDISGKSMLEDLLQEAITDGRIDFADTDDWHKRWASGGSFNDAYYKAGVPKRKVSNPLIMTSTMLNCSHEQRRQLRLAQIAKRTKREGEIKWLP